MVPKLCSNCVFVNHEFASNLECVKIVYCSTTKSAFRGGDRQHYEIKDLIHSEATLTSCR